MTLHYERSQPADTATGRATPGPIGTWVIDPASSSVSFAWHKLRLWTVTSRLHCLGVIHLGELPPVGVIQFEQSSGLPVLTIALDPASIELHGADLDAMLDGPDVMDVGRHRWWTLRNESLEVLPTGAWRVTATLTTSGTTSLVELRFEVDLKASSADWLVLRGHGVLDRRAFGIASPASTIPRIRLDLVVRARRAGSHTHTQ
jgi:polyisoprenoid-binding protein YceI